MSELPLAVRIAAGLAATAVERARKLPQDLAELPVTAASRAMQMSMRLQQGLTDLAIKGDNAIATLRTPSEDPPWAVFDEDLQDGDKAAADLTGTPQEAARDWYEAEYAQAVVPVEPAVELDDAPAQAVDTAAVVDDAAVERPAGGMVVGAVGPGVLPGYPELSLASVRARLRALGVDDLEALLVYEQANENRAEFVRMLTNRITTVRDQ